MTWMQFSAWMRSHCYGRANARKRATLAAQLGTSVRELKHLAEEARLAGIPIGFYSDSVHGGLFFCADEREVQEQIDRLERLALSVLRERSALKRALEAARQKEDQMELPL